MVSQRDWKNYYMYNSSYVNIANESDKPLIAYVVIEEIFDSLPEGMKKGIRECTEEDLLTIDDYRRGRHIYPRPLT